MKVEGAIHRQFSQLYKGLEQQALGFDASAGLSWANRTQERRRRGVRVCFMMGL